MSRGAGWLVLGAAWLLGLAARVEGLLYFAYGSNLLADRIHINNPSARFVGAAKLENYRLDFIKNSSYWNGAAATIVPDTTQEVWGALWEMADSERESLDRQEAVHLNWYYAKPVTVRTNNGQKLIARTYEQTINPPSLQHNQLLPMERRPSITYLKVIIKGAIECGIPEYYIRYLFSIPHNGFDASSEVLERIGNLDSVYLYPSNFITRVPH